MRRTTTLAAPVAVAALALTACSSSSKSAGDTPTVTSPSAVATSAGSSSAAPAALDPSVTLTLYNGQHEETTGALVKAFTAKTGVKVKVRSDDEDVLGQQIQDEGSKSQADVFYTENTPVLARLDAKHLLAPVDPAALADVPAQYSASTKDWLGVSARVAVIVYNTDKIKPADLPTSVLDLADPKYKGKIEIAPGETDFQPIVTSIVAADGEAKAKAFLKGLSDNGGEPVADNETLVADVNKGTTDFGLINSYYWFRLQAELGKAKMHSAVAYFAPKDPGYLLNVSGAAVVAASKHQPEAQALLDFLVSAEGEKVLADSDSFEYPLGSNAPANPELPALSTLQPIDFSLDQIGGGEKATQLLQDAGLL